MFRRSRRRTRAEREISVRSGEHVLILSPNGDGVFSSARSGGRGLTHSGRPGKASQLSGRSGKLPCMTSPRELADRFHSDWLEVHPFDASNYGIPGYDNRVPDASEAGEAAWRDRVEELLGELLANSHVAVGRAKRVIDASARPALAATLEMEVAVQEYCVAAMRESARSAQAEGVPALAE